MNQYIPKPYIIEEIVDFTEDVKLFKIKSNLNPKPGQFIEVSIPGYGECPLASCSNDENYIHMLTRNVGNLTTMMFKLKKGDKIFIRGPYGKGFPIKNLKNKNILLIAGGTGIAPVTSLLHYIEKHRNDFKEVYAYFGFRNERYILLKDKIKDWQKKFKIVICLDKKENNECELKCEIGFIHDVMDKIKPLIDNTIAVLCGPEIMMDCVTEKLKKQGMKENRIFWSLERRMECGFGNCNRCLIQDLYVCKDGPVFRYDIIKTRIDNEEYSNKIKTN
ncbi:MAG: FAD/NAD(P)-binding protein [Candidatus Pacearchaeota archaeon]